MSIVLKAGIELPITRKQITQQKINDFAELSGGTDPIHIDPEYAAKTEFKSTLAHGLMQVGYISEILYTCFGQAWLSNGTMNIKFVAPVKVNEEITTTGTIERVECLQDKKKIHCHMTCSNEKGAVIVAETAVTLNT